MKLALFPAKFTIAALALAALAPVATAQESIPLEEAQKVAQKLAAAAPAASELPFAVDADATHPVGIKGGEAGVMVLPDKALKADAIEGAGASFVPIAQLWSLKITVGSGGRGFASDRLRVVTVGDGEKAREVQLFNLGLVKTEQGALELAVFGKGGEPLVRVPVRKTSGSAGSQPIEVSAIKTGEASARLTLNLLGQYSADLDVLKAE